ncbi:MAG: hypothetical protein GTO40_17580 [Deltaproteobacteria bacterium]|nr:hypothetical protein [Deltaproteobacteria bacterium]
MGKFIKFISVLAVGGVLLVVLLLFALQHLVQVGEFRRILIREVEDRTQFKVNAGKAEYHLGRVVGISIHDFALSDPKKPQPVLVSERVIIQIAIVPLLWRKVVLDGIYFHNPHIRFDRSSGQNPRVFDLVVALFGSNINKVGIHNGQVVFREPRKRGGMTTTYFHDMDLELRHIDPGDISPFGTGPGVSALGYSINTTVEKDGARAGLASEGEVVFPDDRFEFQHTWLDVRVAVEALPARLLPDFFANLLPLKGVRGVLSSSVRWEGILSENLQIVGELNFAKLKVAFPDSSLKALTLGDGRLELNLGVLPGEIRFERLSYNSNDMELSAQGLMRSPMEKDPYVELNLASSYIPLLTLWKYVPPHLKSSTAKAWVKGVKKGEVRLTGANIKGRLSEVRDMFGPGFENRLTAQAEVRDLTWIPTHKRFLPVENLSGRLALDGGVLSYSRFQGNYGQVVLADIEGSYTIATGENPLEVRVRGSTDLERLWKQLAAHFLPDRLIRTTGGIQNLSGSGKFIVYLRTDFKSPLFYRGQVLLEDAGLRVGNFNLSKVHGHVSFSPTEIRTGGVTVRIGGTPIRLGGVLKGYQSGRPNFDLEVDLPNVRLGGVTRMLLSVGSLDDPGTVRGKVNYRGTLGKNGERQLTGALELKRVRLPFRLFKKPIEDVSGKIKLDRFGVDFKEIKGQVGGYGLKFRGRYDYYEKPQLTFLATSAVMDLTGLLPRGPSPKPPSPAMERWYGGLEVKGKLKVDNGAYKAFNFTDLSSDLSLKNRQWTFSNVSAQSSGGTVRGTASLVDHPGKKLTFTVEPDIQRLPVDQLLGFFGVKTNEVTGRVDLSGTFNSTGETVPQRKKNLNGVFRMRMQEGMVRRFKILVRVLSLMDLSRWFTLRMPDVNNEGVQYRYVSGDFKIDKGIYSTRDFVLDSEDLRVSGAGTLDGSEGTINFVVAVRPFPKLDAAANYIPILGKGIAGIKNSLLVASFRIKGPVKKPNITPAPLSTLSEFFFGALSIPRDMIGLPKWERQ